ncbi:MAG: NAD(P)-binding domain-containing protein, partial [Chloroflexi bacterium]|nr:NAD(P)-binding domain-containing protein [Chloroflexota bacterium]
PGRGTTAGDQSSTGSRQAENAERVAAMLNEDLGMESITGWPNDDAARERDISVLTVVATAHQPALESLKEALHGKILADATARIDFREPKPPAPPSAAEIAQEILGDEVRVVAAFQNVPAHTLKKNLDGSIDTDVLVCSDDVDAADQVIQLTEAAGMRAYYAGGLKNAITVEGLTALLISLNKHYKSKTASIGITGIRNQ